MKAVRASLGRALDRPDRSVRFYLFHGPDEAGSRALGERLLAGLGGADKHPLDAASLRSNPALLADEAAAISLFGGPRGLWLDPAGDEIAAAVEALLALGSIESPVIAITGSLRKSSPLLKLAEAAPLALAHISYPLEPRDANRLVAELGKAEGLRIGGDVAGRIATACGNDRAIIALELAKLALYLDCSADRPQMLDHGALDAISADFAEGNAQRVGDLALSGELKSLVDELGRLGADGAEPLAIVRAVQRRLLMLAPLRARVERGEAPAAVLDSLGKSLFWRDKPLVGELLTRLSAVRLAELVERVAELEGRLMRSAMPLDALLGEELVGIALTERRARRN